MFTVGQVYYTKGGYRVIITDTHNNSDSDYCYVVEFLEDYNSGAIVLWTKEGKFLANEKSHPFDMFRLIQPYRKSR